MQNIDRSDDRRAQLPDQPEVLLRRIVVDESLHLPGRSRCPESGDQSPDLPAEATTSDDHDIVAHR